VNRAPLVLVLVVLAAGCKKHLSDQGEAWLTAVDRQLEHSVAVSLAICKPERGDADAWQATATDSAYDLAFADQVTCLDVATCVKAIVAEPAAQAEKTLPDKSKEPLIAARDTLEKLLATKPPEKTRAQAATVAKDARATSQAAAKLVRMCGSPDKKYDVSQAMTELDEARSRFRQSVKTMRADPLLPVTSSSAAGAPALQASTSSTGSACSSDPTPATGRRCNRRSRRTAAPREPPRGSSRPSTAPCRRLRPSAR
jgi:hypothetical protein